MKGWTWTALGIALGLGGCQSGLRRSGENLESSNPSSPRQRSLCVPCPPGVSEGLLEPGPPLRP